MNYLKLKRILKKNRLCLDLKKITIQVYHNIQQYLINLKEMHLHSPCLYLCFTKSDVKLRDFMIFIICQIYTLVNLNIIFGIVIGLFCTLQVRFQQANTVYQLSLSLTCIGIWMIYMRTININAMKKLDGKFKK